MLDTRVSAIPTICPNACLVSGQRANITSEGKNGHSVESGVAEVTSTSEQFSNHKIGICGESHWLSTVRRTSVNIVRDVQIDVSYFTSMYGNWAVAERNDWDTSLNHEVEEGYLIVNSWWNLFAKFIFLKQNISANYFSYRNLTYCVYFWKMCLFSFYCTRYTSFSVVRVWKKLWKLH